MDIFAVEAYTASWIEIHQLCALLIAPYVEAYAASWIEIILRGISRYNFKVEAYAASWIEILLSIRNNPFGSTSKPMRLRGLKFPACKQRK